MLPRKPHILPAEAHQSHRAKMEFKAARRAHLHAQGNDPDRIRDLLGSYYLTKIASKNGVLL